MNKKILIGVAIALVSVIVVVLMFFGSGEEIDTEEKTYTVETITVIPENSEDTLEYAAVVKNQDTENVMFPTIATIEKIHVEQGEIVTKGQLLVTVEDDNAQTQVDTAKNNMDAAESTMIEAEESLQLSQMRYDRLITEQSNDTEYQRLKSEHDTALVAKNNAQSDLDDANAKIKIEEDKLSDYESDLQTKTQSEVAVQQRVNSLEAEVAANPGDLDLQADLADARSDLAIATDEKNDAQNLVTSQEQVVQNTIISENRAGKEAALVVANSNYEATRIPYEAKVADMEIELAAAEGDVRTDQIAYDNSKNAHEASVRAYENSLEAKEDLNYYAKNNGTVLTILSKEGEVATPLEPVLVVGTTSMIAEFGVSSSDIEKVELSNHATITLGEEIYTGEVTEIDLIPDETSRTYTTDVLINTKGDNFQIGELVDVQLFVGESMEVLLPINAILNDGEDYVFIVEDGRAVRRDVTIGNISNNKVKILGLNPGEEVIVKGMKNIKSGYKVLVNNND